jgi:CRISPR-associated protein Cas8a1/Csx13
MEHTLKIGLFDPGMTHLHRVGLAGLYMTLKYFQNQGTSFKGASWSLDKTSVTLKWDEKTTFIEKLLKGSFLIQKNGLIQFKCHQDIGIGTLQQIQLHNAILGSFLQHNKQNCIPKGTPRRLASIDLGEKQVAVEYRPLINDYAHRTAASLILTNKGKPANQTKIKSWLFPGAAERHSNLSGTEIEETPSKILCLLFAPVACLYFRISHRGADGKRDKRRGTAIVLPHITDLESYARAYRRYLTSPIERLNADGLGDAGLNALLSMKSEEKIEAIGVTGCSAFMMGTVGWSSQQQTRTAFFNLEDIDDEVLDSFDLSERCLPNKIVVTEPKATKKNPTPNPIYFVATSLCRGYVAENIAASREWYCGFAELMKTEKQSKLVRYEKGGLKEMTEKIKWTQDVDRRFVEAVHVAINHRYGALAARASKRGERIPFDREYERMRIGLMRAKNAQTLRAELADLFARGGINKKLQSDWSDLLPLFSGEEWQKSRDLALLALASYTGKGADEIIAETHDTEQEEED